MTRFARGSLPETNQGPPESPRPRRWPIVNSQCPRWVAEVGSDEVAVANASEKADALAVPAVLGGQPEPGRELSNLGLVQVPHRKQRALELPNADPREEVRLVLDRVGSAVQFDPLIGLDPPRVVAGRHPFEAAARDLGVHPVGEGPELDPRIAEEIGARRPASFEFLEQIGDDPLPVGALQRDHGEGNPELSGDGAGVAEVLLPRTLPEVFEFVLQPHLQVEGVHVVPLLDEPRERDGAVHTSRGENGDAHGDLVLSGPEACRTRAVRSRRRPATGMMTLRPEETT